jgi:hypothetical protein
MVAPSRRPDAYGTARAGEASGFALAPVGGLDLEIRYQRGPSHLACPAAVTHD